MARVRTYLVALTLLGCGDHMLNAQMSVHGEASDLGGGCDQAMPVGINERGAIWSINPMDIIVSFGMIGDVCRNDSCVNGTLQLVSQYGKVVMSQPLTPTSRPHPLVPAFPPIS